MLLQSPPSNRLEIWTIWLVAADKKQLKVCMDWWGDRSVPRISTRGEQMETTMRPLLLQRHNDIRLLKSVPPAAYLELPPNICTAVLDGDAHTYMHIFRWCFSENWVNICDTFCWKASGCLPSPGGAVSWSLSCSHHEVNLGKHRCNHPHLQSQISNLFDFN